MYFFAGSRKLSRRHNPVAHITSGRRFSGICRPEKQDFSRKKETPREGGVTRREVWPKRPGLGFAVLRIPDPVAQRWYLAPAGHSFAGGRSAASVALS